MYTYRYTAYILRAVIILSDTVATFRERAFSQGGGANTKFLRAREVPQFSGETNFKPEVDV